MFYKNPVQPKHKILNGVQMYGIILKKGSPISYWQFPTGFG
jgi:hypothetical protein